MGEKGFEGSITMFMDGEEVGKIKEPISIKDSKKESNEKTFEPFKGDLSFTLKSSVKFKKKKRYTRKEYLKLKKRFTRSAREHDLNQGDNRYVNFFFNQIFRMDYVTELIKLNKKYRSDKKRYKEYIKGRKA